ncbi:FadR/GntR family transcriptional regulator [Candidatus Spongiihabitans sp.]|uniref:FadR/GntR family transcriptional regulator n=1 Tax=Candidatus Spongiihabitans sp. TaxID=3101308 RepID=UPI003C6FB002
MQDHLKVTLGAAGLFNRIRAAIVNGDYAYNERLPTERSLAEQFSVARGTVRAALNQLERANFVRKKFGSGTFVNHDIKFDQDAISEETSPLDLIETRLAIEPYIVKLVVSNANNRELRKLKQALDNVVNCQQDPDSFSSADETFHLMLANCSQNPLLIWIYQRINDIRNHTQWSHRKHNILTPEKIAQYNRQHSDLLNAIIRRDIENASNLMIEHLNQAKKDLLKDS